MESLSYKDIYERAWQCRDFELTNFWQRSAFLGTFMALTYAGYGALCLALFGCEEPLSENRWLLFNGFAVGVALFGALFSALWILMAKGSKAWFEWHEAAINALQAELPEAAFGPKEVKTLAAFQVMKLPAFKRHWHDSGRNTCYLSTSNGPFSVSRITICLGQISLIVWGLIAVGHLLCLTVGQPRMAAFLTRNAACLAFTLLFLVGLYIVVFLRKQVHSRVLADN
ncbi:MAG: hypothetical protein ACI4QJ_01845 [Candidatus Spyradenecus sp.]